MFASYHNASFGEFKMIFAISGISFYYSKEKKTKIIFTMKHSVAVRVNQSKHCPTAFIYCFGI